MAPAEGSIVSAANRRAAWRHASWRSVRRRSMPGHWCGGLVELGLDQRGQRRDRGEVADVEIVALRDDRELALDEGQELQREQRVDEPQVEDVVVVVDRIGD